MPALLSTRSPIELPIPSRACSAGHRAVLRRIRETGCDLTQWDRSLPAEVTAFCANLTARRGPLELDVTAEPGPALLAALAATAPFSRAEFHAPAHWLLEDIAALATEFAALTDCSEVRARLTIVSDDGCAAFHVDTLPVRMLCTYAGRGTQWADEPDVRRAELGLRNRTTAEANAAIVPDAARIRTMPTGAVAIFKGRLWSGAEQHGFVHRSHPVCCGEHARLRLCLDSAGRAS